MRTIEHLRLTAAALLSVLFIAGCADTVPKPQIDHEIVSAMRVRSGDLTQVSVDAPDGVGIQSADKDRLAQKIKAKIDQRKVSNSNASAEAARTFEVDVHVTQYQKGNAFARFMLAGLGQIHIGAKISIFQMPEHSLTGEFELTKTFAWGGAYGASTSMDEIENTFADGVAETVTGQNQAPPKTKT
jgi:hypothetical protein